MAYQPAQVSVKTGPLLLHPVVVPPRLESLTVLPSFEKNLSTTTVLSRGQELEWIFSGHDTSDVMALDFETRGTDASSEEDYIVGVSFADKRGSIYIPLDNDNYRETVLQTLVGFIEKYKPKLIAHNVAFDGSFLYRECLRMGLGWPPFYICTFALYKQLATEGYIGQTWGLKDAQTSLLGWTETNERDLDNWLISNGYANSQGNPLKAEMWRAPSNILGHYCALDSDATYLLFKHVLEPVLNKFPMLLKFHTGAFMSLEKHCILQQLAGLHIDKARMQALQVSLSQRIEATKQAFLIHPEVKDAIDAYNKAVVDEHMSKQPPQFKKCKERPPEPPAYTKAGKPSSLHATWVANADKYIPQVSLNWIRWKEQLEEKSSTNHFNLASGKQRVWLFYTMLGYPVLLWTDNEENPSPSVDEDAMKAFGEAGKLLISWQTMIKELQFCEAYLAACRDGTNGESTVHFRMKIPGTLTGRLSGGH